MGKRQRAKERAALKLAAGDVVANVAEMSNEDFIRHMTARHEDMLDGLEFDPERDASDINGTRLAWEALHSLNHKNNKMTMTHVHAEPEEDR